MTDEKVMASGLVERIGLEGDTGLLTHKPSGKDPFKISQPMPDHKVALKLVLDALMDSEHGVLKSLEEISAVGHRVLHGKETYAESIVVTPKDIEVLKSFIDLGPLHMPANIMGIESCMSLMPGIPQVAVFDTSFHQTMPRKAFLYGLPYEVYEKYGVRRYGFHGTSHRYVSHRAAQILGVPLKDLLMITLHLGNGSSAAAIKDGKVIDTSMGFTPLEGFIMGTRCGDMDPAIVPYLAEKLGLSNSEVDAYMNKKSGLAGLSGISSDMRDIQKAVSEGNPRAIDAYEVFLYRLVKYVGAYYAAMGGLDVIVFTAGIGENDCKVREDLCRSLEFMGVKIDYAKNDGLRGKEAILSTVDSKVKVMLVPTDEELAIAKDAYNLVTKQ